MTKRLLSSVLAVILTLSIIPILTLKADAAAINTFYNRDKALQYASKHWNDGKGLCAEFVSDCLKAGGVTETYNARVVNLYNALVGNNYGKSYKLKITNGSILMSQNEGKIKAGDPIFYYCNVCREFTHVSLCNGSNSAGYAVEYSHNNAHNGQKRTYTYPHCGTSSWTFYSVSMYDKDTVLGEKNELDPPRIISTINVKDGLYFRWNEVEGATYYRIYKRTENSNWKFLANTTSPVYTDETAENGVEYIYTVRACKGSTFSAFYPGVAATHLSIVKIKSVSNSNNNLVVTWQKNPKADGYYLYRQTNNGNWYRIADIKNGNTTSYVDKNVESGNIYRYRIRVFKGACVSSYDVTGKRLRCLDAPKLTSIANVNDGIRVNWNKVNGATEYRVYRRASGERSWSYLETVTTNYYIDNNVNSSTYYRYTIRSMNGAIYGSFDSNGLLIRCVGTPDITGAQYTDNGVRLTWKAVAGAKGYYVYHKAEGAKSWRKIAVLGNQTAYVDKVPSKGSTYYYTVKAFYGYTMSSYYKNGLKCVCDASKGVQTIPELSTTMMADTTAAVTQAITNEPLTEAAQEKSLITTVVAQTTANIQSVSMALAVKINNI